MANAADSSFPQVDDHGVRFCRAPRATFRCSVPHQPRQARRRFRRSAGEPRGRLRLGEASGMGRSGRGDLVDGSTSGAAQEKPTCRLVAGDLLHVAEEHVGVVCAVLTTAVASSMIPLHTPTVTKPHPPVCSCRISVATERVVVSPCSVVPMSVRRLPSWCRIAPRRHRGRAVQGHRHLRGSRDVW